jgi:hypothetical protein
MRNIDGFFSMFTFTISGYASRTAEGVTEDKKNNQSENNTEAGSTADRDHDYHSDALEKKPTRAEDLNINANSTEQASTVD